MTYIEGRVLRLLPLLMAVWLGGCAITDHFDERALQIGGGIEQARDEMIVTNIVRASMSQPLSFYALSQVGGTNQISAQLGLPSVTFGPHQAAIANRFTFGGGSAGDGIANSVASLSSTQFTVQPQETKDFYSGLLTPVSQDTLEFFTLQGVSREVLFYLFSDRIIETRKSGKREYVNDPLDPTFDRFQDYVHRAMDYGLTTEVLPGPEAARPRQNGGPLPRRARLCFEPSLAKVSAKELKDVHPLCGQPVARGHNGGASFVSPDGSSVEIDVRPRSTFGIFQFLGHIVAAGGAGEIHLYSAEAIGNGPFTDDILFHLDRGEHGETSPCLVEVTFGDKHYCAPVEGSANTTRIIGLLAQLIGLSTSLSDLPQTAVVRLQP